MCCPVCGWPGIIARMNADVAIQWRAITAEDGADWARLLLTVEESYGTEDIVGAEDLVEDLRDPYVDPDRGTIAAFSQGSMIAYAGLRASPRVTGRHEMDLHGAVHPSQRGRGLGTWLLAWAEQAARPLHEARYPGHPLALSASCPAGQGDALALFAAAGYQQARWFHFMSRDLTGAVPDGQHPEGTRIAGYAAELSQAARQVRDEAFRDHWAPPRRRPRAGSTSSATRGSARPSASWPTSATNPPACLSPIHQGPDGSVAHRAGVSAQVCRLQSENLRVVPASGNMEVRGKQFWLGTARSGMPPRRRFPRRALA